MTVPQAVVLERNKLVIRRIARVLGCAGFEVKTFEEPEKVEAAVLEAATLVMADAFDADLVMKWLRLHPRLKAALYSGEPVDRLLGKALEEPRLVALIGRPSFDVPPREDDLLHIARRTVSTEAAPFEAHLSWGAAGFAYSLTDAKGRDHAVQETMAFAGKLGAPKRVGEMLGELSHELIMNALYDAPVDEFGKPRFAHDRKAEIALGAEDAAVYRCGSDGVRIACEVVDHFGRLERKHVFGGLVRGLKAGQMDTAGGGAGLGMLVSYRSTTALFFDVEKNLRTRVTALFDLDLNLREFRLLPKTIHFPEGP
ncbi:MAG: hypothetical protein JWN44_4630 [Myxococcales bacterium]|nr:hypothetical protein [Myxococcales bacterium]